MNTTKKITMATLKSFLRKNKGKVYIQVKSTFNGMQDMVTPVDDNGFQIGEETIKCTSNTLGLQGIWIVGNSRDRINKYEDDIFNGFYIYNCCGSFSVAVRK